MRKGLTFFVLAFILVASLFVSHPFFSEYVRGPYRWSWWRQITNPWKVEGNTYCSERHPICVTNVPNWEIRIHAKNFFTPPEPLISFVILTSDADGLPDIIGDVNVTPPESLSSPVYEIHSPVDYLSLGLAKLKRKTGDGAFQLLEPPRKTFIRGKEAAVARLVYPDDDGLLLEVEWYAFIIQKKGFGIAYRTQKGKFEGYREPAMKIIHSLVIKSDAD